MKLINKKTGEVVENVYIRESHDFYNKITIAVFARKGNRPPERISTGYETLAELNEEWGDYEEPKGMWAVGGFGELYEVSGLALNSIKKLKEIGNDFKTEEEAEQAVEKLKALNRLRDKGFRFTGYSEKDREYINQIEIYAETDVFIGGKAVDLAEDPDVKLLFGDEE